MTEAYSTALQPVIDEFKGVAPEIVETFIFNENGEIIANTETGTDEQIKKSIDAFNNISDRAGTVGGIETLIIQGANSQLNITAIKNLHIATVSSLSADEKIVKILSGILIPTVLKLVDQSALELSNNELTQDKNTEVEPIEKVVSPDEQTIQSQSIPDILASFNSEPLLPNPPVNQFMVKKIGGFLTASDTVRIDGEVIAKWHDLYEAKEITWVHIETLEGSAVLCKFKPIKETSLNAKGIIRIPEKILRALQTGEGKLVKVKPEVMIKGEKIDAAKNKHE